MRSSGLIGIRISDLGSLGSCYIKWTKESFSRVDLSVPLMCCGPNDLWSLILTRLIPVERSSQGNVAVGFYRDVLAPFSLQFLTHVSMTVSVYWNTFCAAGPPESLAVTPNDSEVTIENNSALQLQVQVQDKAGNLTVQPRLNVVCKVTMLMFTPLWFN